MYSLLTALLINSVIAAVLFLGVWLVKKIFRFRLSAGMHYVIWCVVVLKLLIPVQLPAAISPWNLLPQQAFVESAQTSAAEGHLTASGEVEQPVESVSADIEDGHALQADTKEQKLAVNWPDVITGVWAAGMAATGLWLLWGIWRLRRNAGSACHAPEWATAIFEQCKRELKLKQNVRLSVGGISVPAVRGVLRPVVMLPASLAERKDEGTMRLILMHELMHIKRADMAVTYLINIINVLYWFNPAVWLLAKLINADMETACDASVLRVLGAESRQPYIRTLVRFAGGKEHMRPVLCLSDNGIKMKRRIEGMFLNKKTNKPVKAIVMLIVCIFAVLCFTAACTPQSAATAHETDNATAGHTESASPAEAEVIRHSIVTDSADMYITITDNPEHDSAETTVVKHSIVTDSADMYITVTENP